jgi:UDP-N-acetylmuramate dehydrogenase
VRPAVDAAAELLGARARRDIPIGPLTTYRVGGAAALLFEVETDDDLRVLAHAVATTGVDVLVVGKGSNLLVADAGFDGLAVVLGPVFETISIDGTTVVGGAPSPPGSPGSNGPWVCPARSAARCV